LFASCIGLISVLSFDLSLITGMFCFFNLSFYDSLLSSTMLLAMIVLGITMAHFRAKSKDKDVADDDKARQYIFAVVYILLFAYPVTAVDVVQAFSCHTLDDGVSYLRADYSVVCYTPHWDFMAGYAALWVLFYVVGFPLIVIHQLWRFHQQRKEARQRFPVVEKRPVLAFLADDYKPMMPMMLWEGQEMVRKLLLSVIGAFWSTKSTMCVATALLISIAFQLLHCSYYPFRTLILNRLQHLSLAVLSLIYFVGVLLKTQTVDNAHSEGVGVLMVLLLVLVILIVIIATALEVRAVMQWTVEVKYAKAAIENQPAVDLNPALKSHEINPEDIEMSLTMLGQGAEATVSKGKYHSMHVALKVATIEKTQDAPLEELIKNAQVEAAVLATLRHPNIVNFYGVALKFHATKVEMITVLELCAASLADRVYDDPKPLSWREKLELAQRIAQGMAYLHSKGVLHRGAHVNAHLYNNVLHDYSSTTVCFFCYLLCTDLKPQNVLLDADMVPKIGDFGLSKTVDDTMKQAEMTTNVGTPLFMPPELIRFDLVERTTAAGAMMDVYSFGLMLWAIMTREKPFMKTIAKHRFDLWGLANHILNGGRPDVAENKVLHRAPAGVAIGAVLLITECWHGDPEKRPGFDEIQDRLGRVLKAITADGSTLPAPIFVSNPMQPEAFSHRGGQITARPSKRHTSLPGGLEVGVSTV
jgi:serine/threonine protein kinase